MNVTVLIVLISLSSIKTLFQIKVEERSKNIFEKDLTSITNLVKLRELDLAAERFKTHNLFSFLQLAKGLTIADGPFANDLTDNNPEFDDNSTDRSTTVSAIELSDTLSTDGTGGSKKHQHCSSKLELIKTIEKQLMHKYIGLFRLRRSLDHLNTASLIARGNYNVQSFMGSLLIMSLLIKIYLFTMFAKRGTNSSWHTMIANFGPLYGVILVIFIVVKIRGLLNPILILFYEARSLFTNKYIEKSDYIDFSFGCVEVFKVAKEAITSIFTSN